MLEHVPLRATVWKADAPPRSRDPISYRGLEARPDARWVRVDPFAHYRPGSRKREPNPGPHAKFLSLRELYRSQSPLFRDAADVFASTYGLLGLFHREYFLPSLPSAKYFVSPEAIVENDGRLRFVDPAGEGLEILGKALNARLSSHGHQYPLQNEPLARVLYPFTEEHYWAVAMPEEVSFIRRTIIGPPLEFVSAGDDRVPWTKARTNYDAVLVLDPTTFLVGTGVSVLTRKEHTLGWMLTFKDFPVSPYTEEHLLFLIRHVVDEMRALGVRDASGVGENGQPTRGWRCDTLLGAMYLMLYMDLMRNAKLSQCALDDCMEYFRPGAQNSIYCTPQHTSLASSRRWLGKEV